MLAPLPCEILNWILMPETEPKRNCHSVFFFYFHFLNPHSTSHWATHFTCTISPNSHIHPVKWALLLQFCSLLQVMWLVFGLWKVLGCITLSTVCAIPNQLFKCHHWDGGQSWAAYYIAGHFIWRRGAWAVGLGSRVRVGTARALPSGGPRF